MTVSPGLQRCAYSSSGRVAASFSSSMSRRLSMPCQPTIDRACEPGVVVLQAVARVGAHQPLGDRRQRCGVIRIDRGDLGPAEHVIVQHHEVVDLGLALGAESRVRGSLAGVQRLRRPRREPRKRTGSTRTTARAGTTNPSARGCCPSGCGSAGVTRPALVWASITLPMVPKYSTLPGLAEDHMVRLGLAEGAGKRKLWLRSDICWSVKCSSE